MSNLQCHEAYRRACQDPKYCFTELDLSLLAELFKKKIQLYSFDGMLKLCCGSKHLESVVLLTDEPQNKSSESLPLFLLVHSFILIRKNVKFNLVLLLSLQLLESQRLCWMLYYTFFQQILQK